MVAHFGLVGIDPACAVEFGADRGPVAERVEMSVGVATNLGADERQERSSCLSPNQSHNRQSEACHKTDSARHNASE